MQSKGSLQAVYRQSRIVYRPSTGHLGKPMVDPYRVVYRQSMEAYSSYRVV